jgi:small-conductance mechanosensitive channel
MTENSNPRGGQGGPMQDWYQPFAVFTTQTLTEVSEFLPRLVAALLILVIGAAIARAFKGVVVKLLETLKVSSWVNNTPVEHFLKNAEMGQKLEGILGSIVYWLLMLLVVHSTVAVLGLESLRGVLERVLSYIPHVISAVLVLFFGTLLAGVVESLVKGSIMSMDGRSARLLGKVSSYLVMTIAVMAAISELGIASEFIMILFIGFVTMLTLGVGLAVGLGGQDVVRDMLTKWYNKTSKEVSKK